jgi:uncharacterized membrane protein YesL
MKFNLDNPFFRFMNSLMDLVWLNILTLALCIPVVTAGASLTAMHYCLIRISRGEESYITKMFFKSFKENFRPATPLWLTELLLGLVLYLDFRIVSRMGDGMGSAVWCVLFVAAVVVLMGVQFLFPLVSRFVQNYRGYLSNSFKLGMACLPRTACMTALTVGPLILMFLFWAYLLPVYFLIGIAGPGFLKAKLYDPVFRRLEEKEAEAS